MLDRGLFIVRKKQKGISDDVSCFIACMVGCWQLREAPLLMQFIAASQSFVFSTSQIHTTTIL
jgi:hypothetical protein